MILIKQATILLAVSHLFFFSCNSFKVDQKISDSLQNEITTNNSGTFYFRESVLDLNGPVPYLTLNGTSYEQGLAYGVLMHASIQQLSVDGKKWLDYSMRRVPSFFRPFVNLGMGFYINQLQQRTPLRYLEEIKGLAQGAGVPWQVLLMSAYGVETQMACTSILAVQDNARGVLHGRNFDFSTTFLGKYPVMIKYMSSEPDEIDYWNLGTISYTGSFHGGNAAGISVSINMAGTNNNKASFAMSWKVREILAKAKNLNDVRKIVAETPNDSIDWILSIASAHENSGLIFDLKNMVQAEEIVIAGKPAISLNSVFGEGRHLENGLARQYLDAYQHIKDKPRRQAAENFLAANKLDSPEILWQFLRNHDTASGFSIFNTRNTTIVRANTLFSVVFDLSRGHISFATGETYAALRAVWVFDTSTESFKLLLPEADVIATDNFRIREKTYLELWQARLDGSLTLDMLGSINPEYLDPYSLDDFGFPLKYLQNITPKIQELIEIFYEKYQNTDGYSTGLLAASLRNTNKTRSIQLREQALASPGINQFSILFNTLQLTHLYQETKQHEKAKASAQKWLALYDDYREGFATENRWLLAQNKTMRSIAEY